LLKRLFCFDHYQGTQNTINIAPLFGSPEGGMIMFGRAKVNHKYQFAPVVIV
jgi:hypothetical protein